MLQEKKEGGVVTGIEEVIGGKTRRGLEND